MIVSLLGTRTKSQNDLITQILNKYGLIEVNPFEKDTIFDPAEMLAYIKNAKLIVTDSFHFSAFSINFNIPFVVFRREGNNIETKMFSRITSLLSTFQLEDRLSEWINLDSVLKCDFTYANKKILDLRNKYYSYLSKNI